MSIVGKTFSCSNIVASRGAAVGSLAVVVAYEYNTERKRKEAELLGFGEAEQETADLVSANMKALELDANALSPEETVAHVAAVAKGKEHLKLSHGSLAALCTQWREVFCARASSRTRAMQPCGRRRNASRTWCSRGRSCPSPA
jgi:hypothetical protein